MTGDAAREIKLMWWQDTYKHSFDNQGMLCITINQHILKRINLIITSNNNINNNPNNNNNNNNNNSNNNIEVGNRGLLLPKPGSLAT